MAATPISSAPTVSPPECRCFEDMFECDEYVQSLGWRSPLVLGFDLEYTARREVAAVQLSDDRRAVVCHLGSRGRTIPPSLARVLSDPGVFKVGVGVEDDFLALRRQFCVNCPASSLVDASLVARDQGITDGRRSLGDLSRDLLGVAKAESLGGWGRPTLGAAQSTYAGRDAWMGLLVARELFSGLGTEGEGFEEWCSRHCVVEGDREETEQREEAFNSVLDHGQARVKAMAHAPLGARSAWAQRRAQQSGDGNIRRRLQDTKRRREHAKKADEEVDNIIQQLKQKRGSTPLPSKRPAGEPPAKKRSQVAKKGEKEEAKSVPPRTSEIVEDFSLNIV